MKKYFYSILIFLLFLFFSQTVMAQEIVYKLKGEEKYRVAEVKPEAIGSFLKNPDIEIAERNLKRHILSAPHDIFYNYQWYLPEIKAQKGWNLEKGKAKTIIAVIDTGIAINHPDLLDNIWVNEDEIAGNGVDDDANGFVDDVKGWDFLNDNKNPRPDLTGKKNKEGLVHATHVAGIAAAVTNNYKGVAGVCPRCIIMPLQVLDDQGSGSIKDIHDAIIYAADNGADVINLSFGSYGGSTIENEAVQYAQDRGIIVIAAAGNDDKNINKRPIYPACHPGVLGVGSTNKNQKAAYFSNYGSDCVDVSAPGTDIFSSFYKNKSIDYDYYYGYLEGTSMSAPMVSGLAGLLKSLDEDLGRKKIMRYIKTNTEDYNLGDKMGTGVINVYKSLKDAKK